MKAGAWRLAIAATALAALVPTGVHAQPSQAGFNGEVWRIRGTPHIWIRDDAGALHWAGDTRALQGHYVNWGQIADVGADYIQTFDKHGDPWLSAGLVKDGEAIYLAKWETDQPAPVLQHIQSIKDVEIFGINGTNYGQFVVERAAWEARYGLSAGGLRHEELAAAVAVAPPPPPTLITPPPPAPAPVYVAPAPPPVAVGPAPPPPPPAPPPAPIYSAPFAAPVGPTYKEHTKTVWLPANGASCRSFFYTNYRAGDRLTASFSEERGRDISLYIAGPDGTVLRDAGKPVPPYTLSVAVPVDGTYRVYFDNCYSLITSKTVTYTVTYPER